MFTPRERFRGSNDAKKWAELIETPWFAQALEAAQHEFVETLPPLTDPMTDTPNTNRADANAFRLDGMRRFRTVLLELTSIEKPKTHGLPPQPLFRRT